MRILENRNHADELEEFWRSNCRQDSLIPLKVSLSYLPHLVQPW